MQSSTLHLCHVPFLLPRKKQTALILRSPPRLPPPAARQSVASCIIFGLSTTNDGIMHNFPEVERKRHRSWLSLSDNSISEKVTHAKHVFRTADHPAARREERHAPSPGSTNGAASPRCHSSGISRRLQKPHFALSHVFRCERGLSEGTRRMAQKKDARAQYALPNLGAAVKRRSDAVSAAFPRSLHFCTRLYQSHT